MVENPQEIEAGRSIVFRLSVMIVCISALTIVHYNLLIGTHKLPQQIIRFGLTIWLCYAVYHGSQSARWIAIVLCSIAGVLFVQMLLNVNNLEMIDGISVGLTGATYFMFAGSLLGSAKVIAFLNYQRNRQAEAIR